MEANAEMKNRRLGKGIGSLINLTPVSVASTHPTKTETIEAHKQAEEVNKQLSGLSSVSVNSLRPSRFQPRKVFDTTQLQQLSQSIQHSGLMQPVVVRRLQVVDGDIQYELVAGERRWRAAMMGGLKSIPAIIRDLSDEEAAEWGLVENIQREDLNPMDRAFALRGLVDRFGLTQEQVAKRIGFDRATVANFLRLCDLEPEIAQLLSAGKISAGHGRALLALPAGEERIRAAQAAAQFAWSVRKLEEIARTRSTEKQIENETTATPRDAVLRDLERQLGQHLGTKVNILADKHGKRGRVILEYYGIDHFDGLISKMGLRTV